MKRSLPLILASGLLATIPLTGVAQADAPILDEAGEEIVATFSIVARDPATGELAVAVQSRAFRAAAIVSYAKAGVGAWFARLACRARGIKCRFEQTGAERGRRVES